MFITQPWSSPQNPSRGRADRVVVVSRLGGSPLISHKSSQREGERPLSPGPSSEQSPLQRSGSGFLGVPAYLSTIWTEMHVLELGHGFSSRGPPFTMFLSPLNEHGTSIGTVKLLKHWSREAWMEMLWSKMCTGGLWAS